MSLDIDPFAEKDVVGSSEATVGVESFVDIRIQQRSGRKAITTVSGLPTNLNFTAVLRELKKRFSCNGSIEKTEDMGTIIKLQGDQRRALQDFLVKEGIVSKDKIKIHGF